MHKPEKLMDSVKEVENILARLMPAAMSERATCANDSLIDELADVQPVTLKWPSKRQYWWQAGIAATLVASAGLVLLDLSRTDADALVAYDFLNTSKSLEQTSDEMSIDLADGYSWSAASYREEDINEIRDRVNGIVIKIGRREVGNMIANISEF